MHRNDRAARRRARRASRRGVATERQKKRLSSHHGSSVTMSWKCPNCGVSWSARRRKCTTHNCRTTKPKTSAGRGVGRRRLVGLLATRMFVLGQLYGQRSLLEVWSSEEGGPIAVKAEASRVSPATMQATATTSATAQVAMDSAEQQEETARRLTELGNIISKLEDIGDPALADMVAAREGGEGDAAKSPARVHADVTTAQAGPGCARKHRQVGKGMEALRLLLEAKDQAWMVVASAIEVAQQKVDAWATRLRREQEQVSAAAMQGAHAGTPQHWAAGFCRGIAAGGRQAVSVGSLDFAPFWAAATKARRDLYQPPQLRVGGPREDGDREVSPERPVLGRPRRLRPRRGHHCGVASCHDGSR